MSYKIVDSDYIAAAGDKIGVKTNDSAISISLPQWPQPGDEIEIVDIEGKFATHNLTVIHNAQPIADVREDLVVSTDDAAFTLIYSGGDTGWQVVRFQ